MGLTKELKGILVGAGLVLAGEIQVDIWDLVAAEPQEGLEGNTPMQPPTINPVNKPIVKYLLLFILLYLCLLYTSRAA